MPAAGTRRTSAPIATGTEWTVPLLERFDVALAAHAGACNSTPIRSSTK